MDLDHANIARLAAIGAIVAPVDAQADALQPLAETAVLIAKARRLGLIALRTNDPLRHFRPLVTTLSHVARGDKQQMKMVR